MSSAYIEAFNSRVRQECLNVSSPSSLGPMALRGDFLSMADARQRTNEGRIDYNKSRPHWALGNLTPSAYAAQLQPTRKVA